VTFTPLEPAVSDGYVEPVRTRRTVLAPAGKGDIASGRHDASTRDSSCDPLAVRFAAFCGPYAVPIPRTSPSPREYRPRDP
jgi:hypothetical protein